LLVCWQSFPNFCDHQTMNSPSSGVPSVFTNILTDFQMWLSSHSGLFWKQLLSLRLHLVSSPSCPDRFWGPPSNVCCYHGDKAVEREVDLSPPSSFEIKNAWSYTSTPVLRDVVLSIDTMYLLLQWSLGTNFSRSTSGIDPIHALIPSKSYPLYHHFYPQLVHVHSEQYHVNDVCYILHPITNKFFPLNCWNDSLMYRH